MIYLDILIEVVLYASAVLALIGSIGMLRFPDFFTRVHAATMVSIGGVCLALLSLLVLTFWSVYTVKLLFMLAFILLTNPTTSHALADAACKAGVKPKKLARNDMGRK